MEHAGTVLHEYPRVMSATTAAGRYTSPLRYPGGKGKLAGLIKCVLESNSPMDAVYVEPYAGGAGIAVSLLLDEYVSRVHINDIDKGVYGFWHSVLNDTDALCRLIRDRRRGSDRSLEARCPLQQDRVDPQDRVDCEIPRSNLSP